MSNYKMPFDPKLTLDPVQTISAKISMQAAETEDAFIFETIGPFIRDHSYIEISKEELIEAIRIAQLRKTARETHSAYFSEYCDLTSATATDRMLHDAYIRGVQHGKDSMYETMMSKFKEMEETDG